MMNILKKKDLKALKLNAEGILLVLLLFIISYFSFIQADRYVSIAKIIVNQSQPIESGASSNFATSIAGQRSRSEDMQLIIEYIKSIEMVEYLDYSIDLKRIYSSKRGDVLSRLSKNADKDELYHFYLKHIKVKTSPDNSIIIVEVQSFDDEASRKILEIIIRRSEEFINKIFHDVAKEQVDFIKNEVLAKEKRILELEKKIRADERKAQSTDSKLENNSLRRKLEFAILAHKESLESLEKVRMESAQNLKKLILITGPTTEKDATYPKRTYNILLFLSIFSLVYLIGRSTYITVVTHKQAR